MNDTYLSVFVSVYRNNSVSLAAKELHLTESAVSRIIKVLEKEYNSVLFERKHKKMTATKAGELLYTSAEKILYENNTIRETLSPSIIKRDGYKLGATSYFTETVLVQLPLTQLINQNLRILSTNTPAFDSLVSSEQIDIALSFTRLNDTVYKNYNLGQDILHIIAHKNSSIPDVLPAKEISSHVLLLPSRSILNRDSIDSAFRTNDIHPDTIIESSSLYFILQMLQKMNGLAFLGSRYLLQDRFNSVLKVVTVPELHFERTVYLSVKRSLLHDAFCQNLIKLITDLFSTEEK